MQVNPILGILKTLGIIALIIACLPVALALVLIVGLFRHATT